MPVVCPLCVAEHPRGAECVPCWHCGQRGCGYDVYGDPYCLTHPPIKYLEWCWLCGQPSTNGGICYECQRYDDAYDYGREEDFFDSLLGDDDILYPTSHTLMVERRQEIADKTGACTYCRPHRGENRSRHISRDDRGKGHGRREQRQMRGKW